MEINQNSIEITQKQIDPSAKYQISRVPRLRKIQRKLSNVFQRVSSRKKQSREERILEQATTKSFKFKCQRKQTTQTNPTVSQRDFRNTNADKKMLELVEKAQYDPFLRRKLKNQISNDLKHLPQAPVLQKSIISSTHSFELNYLDSNSNNSNKLQMFASQNSFNHSIIESNLYDSCKLIDHRDRKMSQKEVENGKSDEILMTQSVKLSKIKVQRKQTNKQILFKDHQSLADSLKEQELKLSKRNQRQLQNGMKDNDKMITFRKYNNQNKTEKFMLLKKLSLHQDLNYCQGVTTPQSLVDEISFGSEAWFSDKKMKNFYKN